MNRKNFDLALLVVLLVAGLMKEPDPYRPSARPLKSHSKE